MPERRNFSGVLCWDDVHAQWGKEREILMIRNTWAIFALLWSVGLVNTAGAAEETYARPTGPESRISRQSVIARTDAAAPATFAPRRAVGGPGAEPNAETTADSGAAELARQRLRDNLSSDMLENFGLFVYVSKATSGPSAQRMFVFQKEPSGGLYLLYDWAVSTGRESLEMSPSGKELPTTTPAGYYELDPARFFVNYRSSQWDEPMPYAMFFKWQDHGVQTGLAIHGATEESVEKLGSRASAGCIRLAPENARILYTVVHDSYAGMVPQLAIDTSTDTIMNNGMLEHDAQGRLKFTKGYRVLVFVDEYGGQDLEASLY